MLQQARANPATFESGRAPLEKAEVALRDARTSYMKREEDNYVHALRMGEGYVALAEARGDQLEANRKIASLNNDRAEIGLGRTLPPGECRRGCNRPGPGRHRNRPGRQTRETSASQSEIAAATAVANSAASESARLAAEARTTALRAELASFEQKKTDLGVTLILRDLQFASASSVLGAGAQGRLAPLAAFLGKQPDTRIQIAGHTDCTGQRTLSIWTLSGQPCSFWSAPTSSSTGVVANRITSVGMGETAPTATNDTAAGRAINRRVEVTHH